MFACRIICRRIQVLQKHFWPQRYRTFSDESKNFPKIMILGGGLEKLQGSIQEEEYFTSKNYGLLNKMRDHEDHAAKVDGDLLENWDEYNKSINHAALQDSCLMNKHKNCLEEAYFMAETADCVKLVSDRLKAGDSLNSDGNTKDAAKEGDEIEMESN